MRPSAMAILIVLVATAAACADVTAPAVREAPAYSEATGAGPTCDHPTMFDTDTCVLLWNWIREAGNTDAVALCKLSIYITGNDYFGFPTFGECVIGVEELISNS